jgi:hypothetical protein
MGTQVPGVVIQRVESVPWHDSFSGELHGEIGLDRLRISARLGTGTEYAGILNRSVSGCPFLRTNERWNLGMQVPKSGVARKGI